MSKVSRRRFGRAFKLEVVRRMAAGESGSRPRRAAVAGTTSGSTPTSSRTWSIASSSATSSGSASAPAKPARTWPTRSTARRDERVSCPRECHPPGSGANPRKTAVPVVFGVGDAVSPSSPARIRFTPAPAGPTASRWPISTSRRSNPSARRCGPPAGSRGWRGTPPSASGSPRSTRRSRRTRRASPAERARQFREQRTRSREDASETDLLRHPAAPNAASFAAAIERERRHGRSSGTRKNRW